MTESIGLDAAMVPDRPQPSAPKTAKGRQTREAILAALKRVLNSQGYHGTTISQVVAEAGVPTGSFYRYFAGKPEATVELLERLLDNYLAAIPAARDLPSFWERELALHLSHAGLYKSDRGLLGCYFTYDTSVPAFASAFWEHTKGFLDSHILALAAVRPGSDLPVALLRPALLALVSMTENVIFRRFTGRDPGLGLSAEQLVYAVLRLRHRALFLSDPPPSTAPDPDPAPAGEGLAEAGAPFVTDPTGRRKDSQLTLQRMRQATLTLLDTSGYEELRLSDIEEASGLTRGAIYPHDKDKRELVLSIVSERLADITLALERVEIRPGDAAFASLLALNAVFVDAFSASRALMKTLYHLEEVDADFGAYYQQVRGGWATTLAEKLESLCDGAIPARKDIAAFAFLAMTDRFLYDIYSLRYDEFEDLRAAPDQAARLLALIWHRALLARNPSVQV